MLELDRRAGELWYEDAELVAPQTCDRVAAGEDGLEPPCELDQQQVAVVMAQRVIDLLEAIEVEQQDR